MYKQMITITGFAKLLRTSRQTIYRHRKNNPNFPVAHRYAGGLRFDPDDVERYVKLRLNDN
jgi:predicted DNA-binding transcriptional regulator AlpA